MSIRSFSFSLVGAALFLMPSLPAVALAATAASPSNADVQEMQAVENTWDAAVNKRDQYGLENVLSPQLVDIAATGDVTTRNQDIVKLMTKDALPVSMSQTVLTVRTLGEGLALVSGTYTLRWPIAAASATPGTIDEKGIFTHVFQSVNGRWVCLNSQRTVVTEQMPQARVKAATPRAKSNAAEPFHIPLIYKGAQSGTATQPAAAPPN